MAAMRLLSCAKISKIELCGTILIRNVPYFRQNASFQNKRGKSNTEIAVEQENGHFTREWRGVANRSYRNNRSRPGFRQNAVHL